MRDYWEHWEFLGFRNLFSQRCQSVCRDRKARSSSLCAWPASLEAKQSTTIKSSWSRSNRTAHKSCHYFQVSKILAISIFINSAFLLCEIQVRRTILSHFVKNPFFFVQKVDLAKPTLCLWCMWNSTHPNLQKVSDPNKWFSVFFMTKIWIFTKNCYLFIWRKFCTKKYTFEAVCADLNRWKQCKGNFFLFWCKIEITFATTLKLDYCTENQDVSRIQRQTRRFYGW